MEFNKGYGSYTHQPVIKGVLDLYNPDCVLELGIGMYSTPLLNDGKRQYQGIEQDKEWIDFMKTPNVIWHNMGDIKTGTKWDQLTVRDYYNISQYYGGLALFEVPKRLLFIDNYASCRVIAFNELWKKFDLIIVHDCEPNAVEWYGWNNLRYEWLVAYYLTSYESWTGLFIRPAKDRGYEVIKQAIEPYIKELEAKDGDLNMHLIENDYHI